MCIYMHINNYICLRTKYKFHTDSFWWFEITFSLYLHTFVSADLLGLPEIASTNWFFLS